MKPTHLAVLAAAFLILLASTASARAVRPWPYSELLEKSDLVVIATPTGTTDTSEQIDLPGFTGQHVVGVETKFAISAVFKGDQAAKEITLHHYRIADGAPSVPNGPMFIAFQPADNQLLIKPAYLLFVVCEADGRYAPVVGQTDPALGIRQLVGAGGEPTKMSMDQLADILKRCATIKPGMTRAELAKVFSTEGGLSTNKHRTYVFSSLPYIKVDVDFTLSNPEQTDEQPTDKIEKISKPYLEWRIGD